LIVLRESARRHGENNGNNPGRSWVRSTSQLRSGAKYHKNQNFVLAIGFLDAHDLSSNVTAKETDMNNILSIVESLRSIIADTVPVPEAGATVLLLTIGLTSLALIRRKRK